MVVLELTHSDNGSTNQSYNSTVNIPHRPKDHAINGFPVTYRVCQAGGHYFWAPRGVSRNEVARLWRVYHAHEKGIFESVEYDDQHDGDIGKALDAAVSKLTDSFRKSVSRFIVDKRVRNPGFQSKEALGTGYTGVYISRSASRSTKALVVSVLTSIESEGTIKPDSVYTGRIAENDYRNHPQATANRLSEIIRRAVGIRRHYYQSYRSRGLMPDKRLKWDDVPPSIRKQEFRAPSLDISEIFDSFDAHGSKQVTTTGGDPEKLAIKLQSLDLRNPQSKVVLNGHALNFRKTRVFSDTFYLPAQIYRARNEWRIRIPDGDGWVLDEFPDADFNGNIEESLRNAWIYTISTIRGMEVIGGEPRNHIHSKSVGLLDPCVPHASVMLQNRPTRNGEDRWSFKVMFRQQRNDKSLRTLTLASWDAENVTDDQIHKTLCSLSALQAFREFQLEQGLSKDEAQVSLNDDIPRFFYPPQPIKAISADDLRFHLELMGLR